VLPDIVLRNPLPFSGFETSCRATSGCPCRRRQTWRDSTHIGVSVGMRRRCDCRQYDGGCDDGFHWFTYPGRGAREPTELSAIRKRLAITKRVDLGGLAGASWLVGVRVAGNENGRSKNGPCANARLFLVVSALHCRSDAASLAPTQPIASTNSSNKSSRSENGSRK
jgi:hypothetical protein